MILVVVAHPDDESLWFGGTLLRLAAAGRSPLTIVSLTNASNAVRAREFGEACRRLRARGEMFDLPDGEQTPLPDPAPLLDAWLERQGSIAGPPSVVLSHAPHGNERSHFQHVQCHLHARRWARARGLPFGFFCEFDPFNLKTPVAARDDGRIRLYRVAYPPIPAASPAEEATTVKGAVAVNLDRDDKHGLLNVYGSQIVELMRYDHYQDRWEWVFFEDWDAANGFYERV